VQARVGAQPAADGDLGGQLVQRLAGVGAVHQQIDAPVAQVLADHRDEVDGQAEPSWGVLGLPQACQDGQADRPVRQHRQVDQYAHHDPVVGPGGPVASRGERVVVPGGPEDLAAGPAHERVVTDQPDRRVVGDQHGQDQVEQDQAELVG
jgi:hypothetical protein